MEIFNTAKFVIVVDSRTVCRTNDVDSAYTEFLRYMREEERDSDADRGVELFDVREEIIYFFSPWDAKRDGRTADMQFSDCFGEVEFARAVENLRRWYGLE